MYRRDITLTTCIKHSWSKLLVALRSGIPDQAPPLQPCPEPPAETSGRTPDSPASRLLTPLASTLTPFSVAWYLQAWACCFPSSPPSSQMALHRKLRGTQCSARCVVTQQRWKPAVRALVIGSDVVVVRVGLRFGVGEDRAGQCTSSKDQACTSKTLVEAREQCLCTPERGQGVLNVHAQGCCKPGLRA